MPTQVRIYTDPACSWSWGAEPALRRLIWEFDGELDFRWVMGGLARRFGSDYRDSEGAIGEGPDCFADLISHWLDVTAETRMPCDPRIWTQPRGLRRRPRRGARTPRRGPRGGER